MKKTLSIILAILMIVTTVPFAFAADDYAVVDTEAGTVTIDGTLGGKTEATEEDLNAMVEILKNCVESGITTVIVTGSQPAKLLSQGYLIPLTSLAFEQLTYAYQAEKTDSYWGTVDLIYQDVTEIVEWEFYVCDVLKSITLPKVTTVGDSGFWACYYLETLTFGSVVTDISYQSFEVFYDLGYEIGGCNLVLNCGQLDAEFDYQPNLEDNTWWSHGSTGEWKSITLTHNGGEATCVAKAVCETCGEEYGDIAPDAHDIVIDKAVAPDCANTGLTQGEHCTRCDYKVEQEVVPALNHKDTLVQVDAKAPTCTEIGWDAYEYCTACTYTTYVEIPENGHTPLEAVKENEVASKCGVAGSYDLVVYCDDCGAELDRDTKTVDALKHSFTKYEVTEEAKCGVEGKEAAYCDNGCGEADEKVIDALTHTDADGDYICDHGCGYEYEKPAPEEPTPDIPDEPTDEEDTCTDCGKVHNGFFSEIICFFAKIINFIKNLFA